MFKFKNKINDIWNMVKKNKRIGYLSIISLLILFCLALNVTFARYTTSKSINGANVTVGDLKYRMVINNTELGSSVGTKVPTNTIIGDRIILSKAGKTEQFNIILTSLINYDTKYEITYRVCTDVNCTKFIDTPESLSVMYNVDTPYITGTLSANNNIIVSVVTDNTDSKDYYIQVDLNAGYSHNTLSLQKQISIGYASRIMESDLEILAYVNGVEVENFPRTNNYNASISCTAPGNSTSNIIGTATWNGSKWIINVASIDSRNTICKVYFTEKTGEEVNAPTGWYAADDGTLLAAIRNENVIGVAATSPGKERSSSSEKVFARAEDDYGTSFYYRGAVTNNFVVFAKMCWRIVRVTGDGSIKITLYNHNDSNVTNPCNTTGNNLAFAKYSGSTYNSVFNSSYELSQFTGFMYGTGNSVGTFAAAFQNNIDSKILVNLKTWYDLKLRNYNDMLADTIWCNDKNTTGNPGSTDTINFPAYNRSAGYSNDYYYPAQGTGPTLLCSKINKTNVDANLSRYTANDTLNGNGKLRGSNGSGSLLYKIGLLTYDEVAFAGGVLSSFSHANTTYYLYANTNSAWWTMTPHHSLYYSENSTTYTYGIYVDSGGQMHESLLYNGYGVRPAVSLLSSTEIKSGGTGTATNPYVVKTS